MMASTGLLFLTSVNRLGPLLSAASKHVSRTLYVHLYPNSPKQTTPPFPRNLLRSLTAVYTNSARVCDHLDVRVLLTPLKTNAGGGHLVGLKTKKMPEVVLTDTRVRPDQLGPYCKLPILHLDEGLDGEISPEDNVEERFQVYNKVVLGGTFDRLHNGHKIFLTEALMRCGHQLTVGVTDGPMLNRKVLWELIQPVSLRTELLRDFLEDVDSSVKYDIQRITDAYGPSTEDGGLECIVVTQETVSGGNKVNEERLMKGMSVLDVHVVNVALDERRSEREEAKISSSSTRIRLLGTRLKDPTPRPHLPELPYVIGLTGGIASGKSSIAAYTQRLGAAVVNCDKLGHGVYRKGSKVLEDIVAEFGSDVVDRSGNVDRKLLGLKVFTSQERLQRLNQLVWPHVKKMAVDEVRRLADEGARVVVLEAALLLEAGWEEMVHEVWVAIVPRDEAVKRIQARDSLDKDQALRRVASQSTNSQKVSKADVVFSTLWEPEFSFSQVTKAWQQIQRQLELLNK